MNNQFEYERLQITKLMMNTDDGVHERATDHERLARGNTDEHEFEYTRPRTTTDNKNDRHHTV